MTPALRHGLAWASNGVEGRHSDFIRSQTSSTGNWGGALAESAACCCPGESGETLTAGGASRTPAGLDRDKGMRRGAAGNASAFFGLHPPAKFGAFAVRLTRSPRKARRARGWRCEGLALQIVTSALLVAKCFCSTVEEDAEKSSSLSSLTPHNVRMKS